MGINARARAMDNFFTFLLSSTYMNALAQYAVGQGTFIGSAWVDHDPGNSESLDQDQLSEILKGWISDGLAPTPDSSNLDLVHVIFAPAEVALTINGRTDFCAYHYWGMYKKIFGKHNLFWAVVDTTGGTSAVSHELVEIFTDRSGNGWYSNTSGDEIADLCSLCGGGAVSLSGFSLAAYWLVDHARCLAQYDLEPFPTGEVPGVVGRPFQEAIKMIRDAGFNFEQRLSVDHTCNNIGNVLGQVPKGGSIEPLTSSVTIWIGQRPPYPCP